jgi:hypothetical protein
LVKGFLSPKISSLHPFARQHDDGGSDSGHVRIFEWKNDARVKRGDDIDGVQPYEQFDRAVGLSPDGNIVAVGTPLSDGINEVNSGHRKMFE